jgi:hypothetical protein
MREPLSRPTDDMLTLHTPAIGVTSFSEQLQPVKSAVTQPADLPLPYRLKDATLKWRILVDHRHGIISLPSQCASEKNRVGFLSARIALPSSLRFILQRDYR